MKTKKQIIAPNINFIIIDNFRTLLLWIDRKQIALFYQFYDKYTPRKELWHFFCMYMWHFVLQKFFFFESICHTFLVTVTMRKAVQLEIVAANISSIKMYHIEESFFAFFLCTKQLWLHPLNTAKFFPINTAKL